MAFIETEMTGGAGLGGELGGDFVQVGFEMQVDLQVKKSRRQFSRFSHL